MHNEVSGTVHGPVVQARDIGTLNVHGTEPDYPPLTSWSDCPELTDELRDLMHVQRDAAESLPYKLLGVKRPELTRVYVQQSVRAQESCAEREPGELDSADADRPVLIEEALSSDHHLLITGEPGAGKSTLGQMYVQRLASEWLDPSGNPPLAEPVLPLRIPAKALALDATWSEALAHAVRDRRLNAPLGQEVFARRALGARWLIFVDGLDEIAEPDTRKQVIDAIVSRMRRGNDHKLVITTRPLPPSELQRLQGKHVGLYTIQPFGPLELREFASAWFRAQDPTRAVARAENFVRQVHDGRLRELVRNPLLATIAAIANTLEPRRELPHNRADLYERFMSYLLDDTASGRNTIAELRRLLATDPARLQRIESLHSRRRELVEHLAEQRLETERPLLDIATEWAGPEHSQVDLAAVLASTGVFVQTENGLKFLHHSFAEFVAARKLVEQIPPGFPQLDELVKQAVKGTKQNSVLFTLALWGRKHGHDLEVVFQRLLDGGRDHVVLAGRLLAEEVAVPPELAARVIDRLLELLIADRLEIRSAIPAPPTPRMINVGRVLAELSSTVAKDSIEKVRNLRDNADLAQGVRLECALVLGHIDSPLRAAQWMELFAETCDAALLGAVARALTEILPDGADHAADVVISRATTGADSTVTMSCIAVLLDLRQRHAAAKELLLQLFKRVEEDESEVDGLRGWGTLADLAQRIGCDEEAAWATRKLRDRFELDEPAFDDSVVTLLTRDRTSAMPKVVQQAQSRGERYLVLTARQIAQADERLSADLLLAVARDRATDDRLFVRACQALADIAPEEALNLVQDREWIAYDLMPLASALAPKGVDIAPLVQRLLLSRRSPMWASRIGQVARGVLALGDYGQEVHDCVAVGAPQEWAEVAPELYRAGLTDLSAALVDRLVNAPHHPVALVTCLDKLVVNELPEQATHLFDLVVELAERPDSEIAHRLVPIYQRLGRTDEALALATTAFDRSTNRLRLDLRTTALVGIGGAKSADHVVTSVLAAHLGLSPQLSVAATLLRQGLLSHAAELWLDVVRRHGAAVEKGVEAASLLTRSGYRLQALETVRAALDDGTLTPTNRANLRALQAWLENVTPE